MTSLYVHVLTGRLRIKVPEVKYCPQWAAVVLHTLQKLPGVISVQVNPTTGSVLVFFHSEIVTPEEVILALRRSGCLQGISTIVSQRSGRSSSVQSLVETVLETVVETAVQTAVKHLMATLM